MVMLKTLYKPLGLLVSVAGGIAAGAIFLVSGLWSPVKTTHRRPLTSTAAGGRSSQPLGYRARSSAWLKPRSTEVEPPGSERSPGYGPVSDPVPWGRNCYVT